MHCHRAFCTALATFFGSAVIAAPSEFLTAPARNDVNECFHYHASLEYEGLVAIQAGFSGRYNSRMQMDLVREVSCAPGYDGIWFVRSWDFRSTVIEEVGSQRGERREHSGKTEGCRLQSVSRRPGSGLRDDYEACSMAAIEHNLKGLPCLSVLWTAIPSPFSPQPLFYIKGNNVYGYDLEGVDLEGPIGYVTDGRIALTKSQSFGEPMFLSNPNAMEGRIGESRLNRAERELLREECGTCLPEADLPPRSITEQNDLAKLTSLLASSEFSQKIVEDPAHRFYLLMNFLQSEVRWEVVRDPKYGDVTASLYLPYTLAYSNGRLYLERTPTPSRKGDGFETELGKTAFDEALSQGVSAALGEAAGTAFGVGYFVLQVGAILEDYGEDNALYLMSPDERQENARERARRVIYNGLAEKMGVRGDGWPQAYFRNLYAEGDIIHRHNQQIRRARKCIPNDPGTDWFKQG